MLPSATATSDAARVTVTSFCSVGAPLTEMAGDSTYVDMTPDGRYVVFACPAGVVGSTVDLHVYRHDRDFDEDGTFDEPGAHETCTVWVTRRWVGLGDCFEPVISDSGEHVAFTSLGRLDARDLNDHADVYRARLSMIGGMFSSELELISVGTANVAGNGASRTPSVSTFGDQVAFSSEASDLVPVDVNQHVEDVFVRRVGAGVTTLESRSSGIPGTQAAMASCLPEISGDERLLVFQSRDALAPGGSAGTPDVYLRTLGVGGGSTTLVRAGATEPSISGGPFQVPSAVAYVDDQGRIEVLDLVSGRVTTDRARRGTLPRVSSDGRFVAYLSPDDSRTYRFDAQIGFSMLVDDGGGSSVDTSNGRGLRPPALRDGGYEVAFHSTSFYDVIPSDSGLYQDVFVATLARSQPFCSGAGVLAACPCQAGTLTSGCENAHATGGVAATVISQEMAAGTAIIVGTGYPVTGRPTAVLMRARAPRPPSVFGDGLLCLGTSLTPLAATFAVNGTSVHAVRHPTVAGTGPFFYQIVYRSHPAGFCDPTFAFNASSGESLVW